MPPVFEIDHADAAGRVGELSIPRADATVETPALMPVVNPHVRTIEPGDLAELGARMLITNSYIFYGSDEYREAALEEGLHEVLDFDGPIMTDSGSFQLAEYGEIDVDTPEILRFQREIGSDIVTPVDIPTEPEAAREQAEAELEETQGRLDVAAGFDAGETLVTAPVQGSTYPDLRERAGREARATGLDVFPIGAVVPLMNDYRYAEVVETVVAAKRGLGPAAPVHLFGAGHPMTFALAAAMGCDLFDSAAYALYARDGRYMTVRGTDHLDDLAYFPCACRVCAEHAPDDLRAAPEEETDRLLAEHNLRVSFAEIRRIRGAIRAGNLLELLEARARGHPALLDGYRALLEHADWLETGDPTRKATFFYLSGESARRPEVRRHHDRLDRLDPPGSLLLAPPGTDAVPDSDPDPDTPDAEYDAVWRLAPAFGPVPPALEQSYPLTAEFPDRLDAQARETAIEGVARLAEAHPETAVSVLVGGWPREPFADLPEGVTLLDPER
ncbi:MAG: tRNA guanosine(15) transglycosylase TgtA [Halobacteriales archaeon]